MTKSTINSSRSLPYTHLMYVRKYSIFTNAYELFVIGVNTDDIFHTMGEYQYRCDSQIERITYSECTKQRLAFWEKEGFKIFEFKDKYKKN